MCWLVFITENRRVWVVWSWLLMSQKKTCRPVLKLYWVEKLATFPKNYTPLDDIGNFAVDVSLTIVLVDQHAIFCRPMLSVCLSVTRMYCDTTTAKQLRVSTVSMVGLKTKFEGGPLNRGLNRSNWSGIGWGGFRLCCAINVTVVYSLKTKCSQGRTVRDRAWLTINQ